MASSAAAKRVAYSIVETSFDEGYPHVEPLLTAHYEELAQFRSIFKINPNLAYYRMLEKAGRLFSLVAFDGDECIGYSCNILTHPLHYADSLVCENDVFYVAPAHRGSRFGLSLMARTTTIAKERGCKLMVWHAKYDTPMDRLLERLDYQILDIKRAKVL